MRVYSLSQEWKIPKKKKALNKKKKTVKLLKGRHLYMFYPAMCEICFIHISKIRGNFLMEMA